MRQTQPVAKQISPVPEAQMPGRARVGGTPVIGDHMSELKRCSAKLSSVADWFRDALPVDVTEDAAPYLAILEGQAQRLDLLLRGMDSATAATTIPHARTDINTGREIGRIAAGLGNRILKLEVNPDAPVAALDTGLFQTIFGPLLLLLSEALDQNAVPDLRVILRRREGMLHASFFGTAAEALARHSQDSNGPRTDLANIRNTLSNHGGDMSIAGPDDLPGAALRISIPL